MEEGSESGEAVFVVEDEIGFFSGFGFLSSEEAVVIEEIPVMSKVVFGHLELIRSAIGPEDESVSLGFELVEFGEKFVVDMEVGVLSDRVVPGNCGEEGEVIDHFFEEVVERW